MTDMTQEEIESGLTPAEIEALKESDGGEGHTLGDSLDGKTQADDNGEEDVDQGAATGKEGGERGQAGGEDDSAASAAGEDSAGADGHAAGAAGAGDGNGDGGSDDAPASGATSAFDQPDPILVAQMPENAEARLKEFADQKAELTRLHEEGDITTAELLEKRDAIDEARQKLQTEITKAELAQDAYQQQTVNTWKAQVKEFTTKLHPEYSTGRARYSALDLYVREVGQEAGFANATAYQILDEAHKRVQKDLGVVAPAAKADPKKGEIKGKDGKDLNAAGRPLKGSKAEAPKTLRDVPAATNNDTDPQAGKFAALDRLQASDPEAHEEAVMKLSPSERDAYLAYGG